MEGIPESLYHYAADNDFNPVFYYARNSDYAEKSLQLLADADALSAFCGGHCNDWKEYRLFSRCISKQTVREEYRGYVANMEESVGENGSVITDYQFE